MAEIQGSCDDLFTAVPGALAALLDAGDMGASAAVFVDGEAVVDVWGGSMVMIEPDARMAVSYVTNQMREPGADNRGLEVVMAAYDGLKGLQA